MLATTCAAASLASLPVGSSAVSSRPAQFAIDSVWQRTGRTCDQAQFGEVGERCESNDDVVRGCFPSRFSAIVCSLFLSSSHRFPRSSGNPSALPDSGFSVPSVLDLWRNLAYSASSRGTTSPVRQPDRRIPGHYSPVYHCVQHFGGAGKILCSQDSFWRASPRGLTWAIFTHCVAQLRYQHILFALGVGTLRNVTWSAPP